jgi:hypothetical protein
MGVGISGSEDAWLTAAQGMITNLNGDGYAIAKWDDSHHHPLVQNDPG